MKRKGVKTSQDLSDVTSELHSEINALQGENERLKLEVAEMQWKEEALRESEKRFRNIALSMVVWIWEMDTNGVYTYCSEHVEDILGYHPDEITDKDFTQFLTNESQKGAHEQFHQFVKERTIIKDWELWKNHKDGRDICVLTSGVPIIHEDGELIGFRGVHKDITEQKNAEEALKQANLRLKRFDKLKSEFVSMVSHEIRTPITIIREGISLCVDGILGDINDKQKEILNDTNETVSRLDRLVTDLLDLSKIEEGKIKLHRSVVDMNHLALKMNQQFQSQAERKGIALQFHIAQNKMPTFVDKDKIIQIFQNLVSNAIRYTKSGGEIQVSIEEESDLFRCFVKDTGAGIASENISKLFSKFEQFGRLEGSGYKGTGLGLAIAKGMVEKHGGKIWVESTLGKGSTFYFTIQKIPVPKLIVHSTNTHHSNRLNKILQSNGLIIEDIHPIDKVVDIAPGTMISLEIYDFESTKSSLETNSVDYIDNTKSRPVPIVLFGNPEVTNNFNENAGFICIDATLTDDEISNCFLEIISEQYAQ